MRQFPEKDWKVIRKLKDQLLQDFCDDTLNQLKPIINNQENGSHKAYLKLWKVLNKKDDELANMFNDLRRSTAYFKLAAWRNSGILADRDFKRFSEETQYLIHSLLEMRHSK